MKKIAAILLCLAMIWSLGPMCVAAADNQAFITGVYQKNEGSLELLCAIPGETGKKEDFQITLGNQEISVLSAVATGEEQLPKTVYCLVDISGSMKGRMEQAKEILNAINDGLHTGDNLVIGRMGNQITDSAFLTDQDDIEAEIDTLSYTGEDTDLYSGLLHGLKFLQQGEEVHEMKTLVVISDGCDDQGAGATWKEAYEAVGKAGISVYTAAIILSAADYEPAKELGSFARNSAGGIHFPQSVDGGSQPANMTGEEMGKGIVAAMEGTMHLTVDLSEVQETQKDTYLLSAAFYSQDGRVLRDSQELGAGELSLPQKEESEIASPSEMMPESDPGQESGTGKYLPYLAGGGSLLAAAIVALAVSASRKRKKEEEQRREAERLRIEAEERERLERARKEEERLEKERKEQELRERLAREEQLSQAQREREAEERKAREEAARRKMEIFNALPRLNIRMSIIGHRDAVVNIQLVKGYEMTVGRNTKARIVLNPQDTKLSGVHFVMFWDGGSVYVWDGQSRNGTAVNGVVVSHLGRVAIRPGDSIRAGSYEYRLYWEE